VRPESTTLSDFRAPDWIVEAEREALAAADRIITPHAELAALFMHKSEQLRWIAPPQRHSRPQGERSRCIVFPGPTIARKGAYDVRDAARALDLEVILLGRDLEGPDFWQGVRTRRPADGVASDCWLASAAAVVQPAQFEEQPRRLLAALSAGVPVVATAG